MDVRTVEAADTRFLLRETGAGDGIPVLLLHGVPQTSTAWRHVAPGLADERRVLAPDLPGLGGSSYAGPFDVEAVVRQVAALVEAEVPGGRVDVVGHDWGGVVALGLAGQRPELVRRLAVANTAYRSLNVLKAFHVPLLALAGLPELVFRAGGARVVETMLDYAWAAPTPLDPAARAEYVAAYTDPVRVHAMLGYYRAAVRPKVKALLGLGAAPSYPPVHAERTLVLWGSADPVLPVSTGEGICKDLGPETVMVTVPGAGHFVVEEAPQVVLEALQELLA